MWSGPSKARLAIGRQTGTWAFRGRAYFGLSGYALLAQLTLIRTSCSVNLL